MVSPDLFLGIRGEPPPCIMSLVVRPGTSKREVQEE